MSADTPYERRFQVAWADLDSNNHMRNTGYHDYAAQTRFLYLNDHGFTPRDFAAFGMGPMVFEETIQYRRELRFLETFRVTYTIAGQSADGSRFIIVNRILKEDGTLSAQISSTGAWVDLKARKVAPPPDALKAAMDALVREPDFKEL